MSPVAYAIPLLLAAGTLASLIAGGPWTLFLPVLAFGLVPIIDQISAGSKDNPSPEEEAQRLATPLFDALIYLTIPMHLLTLVVGLHHISQGYYTGLSLVGAVASVGISCGVFGINNAHELGHRAEKHHQRAAQLLLLSTLYLHFFIEHNRGHHRRVATPDDPASAQRGEILYAFWLRSVTGSWRSAWDLEASRLRNAGRSPWSLDNQMLVFQLIQAGALALVAAFAGPAVAAAWIAVSLIGILLLETVNYMEHYGLARARNERGVYERVRPEHSWNTNRTAGRILLYDLTRHSDHHAHATRPYAILRHHEGVPELPMGYPAMVLLSLVPPLFFAIMHPKIDAWKASAAA